MGSRDRMAAKGFVTLICGLMTSGVGWPGQTDVLEASVVPSSTGAGFDVSVTLRHADSGWDHYANHWEVIGPDGRVLATRTLLHPHVNEQPFTRGLVNVEIPPTTTWVRIRGHDLVHGYGGREVTLSVPHPAPDGLRR